MIEIFNTLTDEGTYENEPKLIGKKSNFINNPAQNLILPLIINSNSHHRNDYDNNVQIKLKKLKKIKQKNCKFFLFLFLFFLPEINKFI